ncbi:MULTISPECIES: MarR family winged helix-turn-helix transcriptional regulator [Bacteria]|jgi:DNA-binding MarR family transcriptional regulator|uniref:MarR family winged helix-turn-helix transcriptional regulator n=1 Tax=Bacteria TaxID=2 RepID=UPI001A9C6B37|nr:MULTISPECIES: MarR family winged helix-turn-helix transcriptional regulator [Bacteria]
MADPRPASSPAPSLVLADFIPYRLSVTSNLVSDSIARTYEALFGLTIPEWRLIAVIAETGGITQQAIGRATRMDKVTVSRAAIALVDRGLLDRRGNPEDRRSHLLDLTDAGRDLYAVVAPKALDLESRIFSQFPADDVARFMEMLRRVEAVTLALDT